MARSLYARLRRKYRPTFTSFTRREFLKITLAASAGLLASGAFADARSRAKSHGRRVVVVGGGFSGLAAAYELICAGYEVTVLEARNRVGGRVLSFRDLVPGKTVEGGGELIGSNHPTWVAYAKQFGLQFNDVTEDEKLDTPVILDGRRLSAKETEAMFEEMETAYGKMTDDARQINADQPWKSPHAEVLDRRSTADWLSGLELSRNTRDAIRAELAGDNGVALSEQSYLGNLTQIKGGGLEKYWEESEVYRCRGGNDQLATKLARAIGSKNLRLNTPVKSIVANGDIMVVTCADGTRLEADDVVLAAPPSVWNKMHISPGISSLRTQMGTNVKYLAALKERFWLQDGISPDAATDGMISMTWDGTDNQGKGQAALVAYSGGPAAKRLRFKSKWGGQKAVNAELTEIYPKFNENFISARFMDWPSDQWTRGGFSFPAPGQIVSVGPALHRGIGHLHFAGEHTCYKFVGYMEGALNSGASIASRLARRDGVFRG